MNVSFYAFIVNDGAVIRLSAFDGWIPCLLGKRQPLLGHLQPATFIALFSGSFRPTAAFIRGCTVFFREVI
jgi:hypothetical protein